MRAMMPPPPPEYRRHGGLSILRIIAVSITIALLALSLSTLYILVPGNLLIDFPTQESTVAEFLNGTIYLRTNLTITNKGLYDLDDVRLRLTVRTQNASLVTDYLHPPFSITSGSRETQRVSVPIDISSWVGRRELVFEDDNITSTIRLSARYTMGLVGFNFSVAVTTLWPALISQLDVFPQNSNFTPSDSMVNWTLPFILGTSSWLSGSAQLNVTVKNETAVIANTTEAVPLGTTVNDNLTFLLSPSAAYDLATRQQTLTVEIRVVLPGNVIFTDTRTVVWIPPGG